MSNQVEVDVEYCAICHYDTVLDELRVAIHKEVPDAKVEGHVGRRGAYEIKINGKLIFSKTFLGGFPYNEQIVEQVKRASLCQPTTVLEEAVSSALACCIL